MVGVKSFPRRELQHLVLSMLLLDAEMILQVSAPDPFNLDRSLRVSPFFSPQVRTPVTLKGENVSRQRQREVCIHIIIALAFV